MELWIQSRATSKVHSRYLLMTKSSVLVWARTRIAGDNGVHEKGAPSVDVERGAHSPCVETELS